jgi:hypothetical protein
MAHGEATRLVPSRPWAEQRCLDQTTGRPDGAMNLFIVDLPMNGDFPYRNSWDIYIYNYINPNASRLPLYVGKVLRRPVQKELGPVPEKVVTSS